MCRVDFESTATVCERFQVTGQTVPPTEINYHAYEVQIQLATDDARISNVTRTGVPYAVKYLAA